MRGLLDQTCVDSSATSAIQTASCAASKSSNAAASRSSWSPSTSTRLRSSATRTLGAAGAEQTSPCPVCPRRQVMGRPQAGQGFHRQCACAEAGERLDVKADTVRVLDARARHDGVSGSIRLSSAGDMCIRFRLHANAQPARALPERPGALDQFIETRLVRIPRFAGVYDRDLAALGRLDQLPVIACFQVGDIGLLVLVVGEHLRAGERAFVATRAPQGLDIRNIGIRCGFILRGGSVRNRSGNRRLIAQDRRDGGWRKCGRFDGTRLLPECLLARQQRLGA